MTSDERAHNVRTAFSEMAQGNPGPFLAQLSDDIVYTVIGDTTFSGTFRGRDNFLANVPARLGVALASPLLLHADNVIASGDYVVVQAHGTANLRSGAPYNNVYCFVFRFDGGIVVEVTEYLDTQLVTRAFGVPGDRDAQLRAMDLNCQDMYREIIRMSRGSLVLETETAWMGHCPRGGPFNNMVMVCGPEDPARLIAAADDFYRPRQKLYSVCVRQHADAEVEAWLRANSFQDMTMMPGMALFGDPGTECAPADLEIRPTIDDQGRRDYLHVTAEAYATYGAPREYSEDAFASLESVCAPHIQGFVGYTDGKPVSAAWLYMSHGIAGIGWVGTVPEQRGHAFGEAVTWAVIREGFRRAGAFANLQASPMGRPVYERMGFSTLTEYRVLIRP
jgi:uncharacterized protein